MFKRRQWIKIAENMILFSVLYLIFWCHFFFCFLRVNMGWSANSLSARMLHLLHQFVPDLYSVTLFLLTSSNAAYSLSGIGRFDKILPYPQRWAGTAFVLGKYQISNVKNIWNNSYLNCGWRMIIAINFQFKESLLSTFCGSDKSTIPPVYLQLSAMLYRPSWAAVHNTFPDRVLASFIHLLPVVTLNDNDSKQIAAATSFRM